MAILFFYPLVFLGDIIILNMTTAVVIVCFNSRAHANFAENKKKQRLNMVRATGLDPLKMRDLVIEQLRQQTRQHLLASASDPSWRVRYACRKSPTKEPCKETY